MASVINIVSVRYSEEIKAKLPISEEKQELYCICVETDTGKCKGASIAETREVAYRNNQTNTFMCMYICYCCA